MANNRGWIEKVDPVSLEGDVRGFLEGWREKAYDDDNVFLTLARRRHTEPRLT